MSRLVERLIGAPGVFSDHHGRLLGGIFAANSLGQGAWLAANLVLFSQAVALLPAEFALGRAVSAAAALVCVIPLVAVADRHGTWRVAVIGSGLQIVAIVAMGAVSGLWSYVLLLGVLTVVRRVMDTLRTVLTLNITSSVGAVHRRAAMRSISNAGLAAGGALAIVPLTIGGRAGLVCAAAMYAATAVITMALTVRLRGACDVGASLGAPQSLRAKYAIRQALSDWPFLLAMATVTVLSLADTVLTFGLPLWIVHRRVAPAWAMGPVLLTNTVLVVVLQARLVAGGDTILTLKRGFWRAGAALGAGLSVFAATAMSNVSAAASVALLIAGTAALSVGEVYFAAATWGIPHLLAPRGAENSYQGAASAVTALRDVAGPWLVSALLVNASGWAWLTAALAFTVTGTVGAAIINGRRQLGTQNGQPAEAVG